MSETEISTETFVSSETYFGGVGVVRTRFTVLVFLGLVVFGLGSIPIASSSFLTIVISVASAVLVLVTLALWRIPQTSRAYDVVVLAGFLATVPIAYGLDFAGPAIGIIVMLLILHNLSVGPRWGIPMTLVTLAANVALYVAMLLGFVTSDTLLHLGSFSDWSYAENSLVTVTILYALSAIVPIVYRRRTGQHLKELAAAGREIAASEALLREARLELDRVVAIGQRGRFTEQRLGSFTLGNILGRGGMGEIYEATHVDTKQRAAVKLLRSAGVESADVIHRFLRESTIAFALESPHIVKVLEVGGMEAPLPFIAMERLDGEDLGKILRRRGKLPASEVVDLVTQIAEGLAVAKSADIVHRDIKPNNLFLTTDGTWKILDFGIARLTGQSGTLTNGALIGTLGYLAPEQLDAKAPLTARTDLHALGCVTYAALTGKSAFVERDPARFLVEVEECLPIRPSAIASVPSEVDDVLRIALAKSPVDRFLDAPAFAKALAAAVAGTIDPILAKKAGDLAAWLPWGKADTIPPPGGPLRRAEVATAILAPATAKVAESKPSVRPPPLTPTPPPSANLVGVSSTVSLVGSTDEVASSMRLARVKTVVWSLVAVALFGFTQLPLNKDPGMRRLGIVFLVVVLVELVLVFDSVRTKNLERFQRVSMVGFVSSTFVVYYFQIYGISVSFLAIGLLLFSLGAGRRESFLAMLCVVIPHTIMSLAVTFGLVSYHGIFVDHASTAGRLWNLAHGVGIYVLAYSLSRIFSAKSRETLESLAKAFRRLAEREALLRDARLELERAAGVGQPGRFTNQKLGRFVLGTVIGRGGMGEVYDARIEGTGEAAAVKLLRPRGGEDLVAQFEREVRVILNLHSEHIVRVIEASSAGLPYLAMERLEGADLGTILQQKLVLPSAEVIELTTQIAKGLEVAHAKGVVHRDIKPQNLFRTTTGTWKLLDFGIADSERAAGTPAYMAPEQLSDAPVTARADVYGLAAVVYRALTGRPPFSSSRDAAGVVERVLRSTPEPPSRVAPVPPAVDSVIAKAMSRTPEKRHSTPSEFAAALANALEAPPPQKKP